MEGRRHGRKLLALLAAVAALALIYPGTALAEPGMLGVVLVDGGNGVRAAHVLPGSPAARAGIRTGDRFVQVAGRAVERLTDLTDTLAAHLPGQRVELTIQRGVRNVTVQAQLLPQQAYRGDVMYYREPGQTGFLAPPWYVYGWGNLSMGQPRPTPRNTRGKVVAMLAFQHTCPRCHTVGLPAFKVVADHFAGTKDVAVFLVQTAFHDPTKNTPEQGVRDAKAAGVAAPVGYDAHVDNVAMSTLMATYGIKGTPWTIVIDSDGVVQVNGYTAENPAGLIERIEALRKK